jgi:hypothetical protein
MFKVIHFMLTVGVNEEAMRSAISGPTKYMAIGLEEAS